jgi:hypothetical protein
MGTRKASNVKYRESDGMARRAGAGNGARERPAVKAATGKPGHSSITAARKPAKETEPPASGTAQNGDHPGCGRPRTLLDLRAAFIFLAALLVSGTTGVLTYLISASLPEACLAAGPACAAVITLLNASSTERYTPGYRLLWHRPQAVAWSRVT